MNKDRRLSWALYNELMAVLKRCPDNEVWSTLTLVITIYLRTAPLDEIEHFNDAINLVTRVRHAHH